MPLLKISLSNPYSHPVCVGVVKASGGNAAPVGVARRFAAARVSRSVRGSGRWDASGLVNSGGASDQLTPRRWESQRGFDAARLVFFVVSSRADTPSPRGGF